MNNRDIAQTFEQIADMLAIRGDHFHKVLAYRRAAENIRELDRDLGRLREEGDLTDIPGIGAALSDKIVLETIDPKPFSDTRKDRR